jgi:hypothetical protein
MAAKNSLQDVIRELDREEPLYGAEVPRPIPACMPIPAQWTVEEDRRLVALERAIRSTLDTLHVLSAELRQRLLDLHQQQERLTLQLERMVAERSASCPRN